MKLSLRFILPLVITLGILSYISVAVVERLNYDWFTTDIEIRARLVTSAISPAITPLIKSANISQIKSVLEQATRDERLYAIGLCDDSGDLQVLSELFPKNISCNTNTLNKFQHGRLIDSAGSEFHVVDFSIKDNHKVLAHLIFVHDMDFAKTRSATSARYIYLLFILLGSALALISTVISRITFRSWVSNVQTLIRKKGAVDTSSPPVPGPLLPVLKELRSLIGELESDKRLYDAARIVWEPNTLRNVLTTRLAGDQIIIVSNREPYIHNTVNGKVEVQVPASGLVTALEPVMRACSGTWIAHGSGSADRQVVDEFDHVWVPPGENSYRIRRVWLTEEEEQNYYYGFSNEGMWPLCHIAHTRPVFRSKDWESYKTVNQRFAKAVVEEAKKEDPVVLIQDYHFAVLPALIREALPRATIITFWHIPWPNAEAFGICPWRQEILKGMLGSTILGFHTRYHRNNFVDTVDRFLECRIDKENFTISHRGELTAIRNYPISIEWPPKRLNLQHSAQECKASIFKKHDLPSYCRMAIGVDRLDYTKGILERFSAVERLLELYPDWIGKFTLIQIAAPSRSKIDSYIHFSNSVDQEVNRINTRFSNNGVPPIILLREHHGAESVFEYLRAADVCLVTSLHDGMNLVAKEFVSARNDEQGVLILSMFTGASRELPEALVVNPYNTDQCAEAIRQALEMSPADQTSRMQSMRDQVKEFNIYRWAGHMLIDAAKVRERSRLLDELSDPQTIRNELRGLMR